MIVANWKCNGSKKMIQDWLKNYMEKLISSKDTYVGMAPPYIYVEHFMNFLIEYGLDIKLGVQDVDKSSGAKTSAISIDMIQDMGCEFTILGHSERRIIFNDSNESIAEKLDKLIDKVNAIYCIGESAEENNTNQTKDILENQLSIINGQTIPSNFSIAYEPVWAIGTGNTPSPEDINDIHKFIKDVVQSTTENNIVPTVLYGGSVNEANAESFFKQNNIDGALIGGASLEGRSFANIVNIFNGKNL